VSLRLCQLYTRRFPATDVNRRFRWAALQLHDILNLKIWRPKYIEQALNTMPKGLDETYKRVLGAIDDMYFEEARTALEWLAFSVEPVTVAQLAEHAASPSMMLNSHFSKKVDMTPLSSSLVSYPLWCWWVNRRTKKTTGPDVARSLYQKGTPLCVTLSAFASPTFRSKSILFRTAYSSLMTHDCQGTHF
jgi:hypothetical protein